MKIASHLRNLALLAFLPLPLYAQESPMTQGATVTPLYQQALPDQPGKTLTVLAVDYAPGGKSAAHWHHESSIIYAYVALGKVLSAVGDAAPKVYASGEGWSEPPGAYHPVSANASETEPARILAIVVADTGAQITRYE